MADQRLPRSKYLRQINDMEQELRSWAERYAFSAKSTDNPYLSERFSEREYQLNKAISGLEQVYDIVLQLPRTSL